MKLRKKYIENVYRIINPGGKYLSVCFSEKDLQFGGSGKYRETPLGTIEISGKFAPHLTNYAFMERK
jgi:hypothetical protein